MAPHLGVYGQHMPDSVIEGKGMKLGGGDRGTGEFRRSQGRRIGGECDQNVLYACMNFTKNQ